MTNLPELVTDRNAFLSLRRECETIIDTQKRLPDLVFRRPFAKYFAIQYAEIFGEEFTSLLSTIACSSKDDSVNYMTLEPDPVSYYFQYYDFYGLASFRPSTLAERYLPVMSREGHADSFRVRGGDVGVFWGSSLKWGIFCDRISWESAVIAVSENIDVPTSAGLRFMDSSFLFSYLKSLYWWDRPKAIEFAKLFAMNYRT